MDFHFYADYGHFYFFLKYFLLTIHLVTKYMTGVILISFNKMHEHVALSD